MHIDNFTRTGRIATPKEVTNAASDIDTPDAAAKAFAKTGAGAACIVGPEETLRRRAGPIASALKKQGAARVFVIGSKTIGTNDIDVALDDGGDATNLLSEVLELSR